MTGQDGNKDQISRGATDVMHATAGAKQKSFNIPATRFKEQ